MATELATPIGVSTNAFSFSIFDAIKGNENLFFSPFSIHSALSMCLAGANGSNKEEMLSVLKLTDEPHEEYKDLLDKLEHPEKASKWATDKNYRLNIANALFIGKKFKIKDPFQQLLIANYQAEVKNLDFENSQASADAVNAWVEKKTEGRIKDLVTPAMFNKETTLTLVNAIYFKATWCNQFKEANTKDDVFHSVGGDTKVKMMTNSENYNYYSDKHGTYVGMPVFGGAYMTIFMSEDDLTEESYRHIMGRMASTKLQLTVPKFKEESQFNLKDVLMKMGMVEAFDSVGCTGFRKIVENWDSYISSVVHKAFIETDENGVEAAAATAVGMMRCCSVRREPDPIPVKIDKPFNYTISDQEGTILFLGKVTKLGK